jgi:DNA-binding NarL/FixJ family response regulator/class 3 adenylate cyclase
MRKAVADGVSISHATAAGVTRPGERASRPSSWWVTPAIPAAMILRTVEASFVTIVCTEIIDSAMRYDRYDAQLDARRAEHFAALRQAIGDHGGREVKSIGDGLMVAFSSTVAAVRCAVDMQRATTGAPSGMPIRIGIDAGEPTADGTDLFGTPVIVARRLCEIARAGEVLATQVVRQIAGARVAELMRPAGTLRLRGSSEPVATALVRWREGDDDEEPPPFATEAPGRPITVVIADDQRLLRAGFRVILDAEPDITVVGEAGDGRAAVDVVARRRPDVALMDIRMPELDGLQAAERILTDADNTTAVVMLTTFDASEYVFQALRLGASGFLLKDTPADRLLDAVRVAAAGEALIAPSITRRLIADFAHLSRPPAASVPPALAELTAREIDVLRLIARGLSNAEIATELVLGENTVKTHVGRVLSKLGLRDRVQAVVLAYETGLVTRDLDA